MRGTTAPDQWAPSPLASPLALALAPLRFASQTIYPVLVLHKRAAIQASRETQSPIYSVELQKHRALERPHPYQTANTVVVDHLALSAW